ncbi:Tubulin-folding cofactor A [Porphyridium purpureum]|uniref:Tubulin-specific chaperone A n=1 Tax=Porphyridium purpureum TaxID=35688 RepID=A0A5J4Z0J8_PORPP|nr:Tubulin-folding cofactor A [Porphyridium purpureum]|eukprot:POR3011..scf208_2
MAAITARDLKIQTDVVRRLCKELDSYKSELHAHEEKVKQLSAEGEDEARLRQWSNVIEETRNMIPCTEARLSEAVSKLEDTLALARTSSSSEVQKQIADTERILETAK